MKRLAVLLLALGCSKHVSAHKSYPGTADGLKTLGGDLLAMAKAHDTSSIKDLSKELVQIDPKFWTDTFGPDVGAKLTAEAKETADMAAHGGLVEFMNGAVDKGRTDIKIVEVEKPDDKNGNGVQLAMLKAEKKPVALWKISFTEPGKELGSSLWSFAYVDGKWRFLGKCRSAKPDYGPEDELPVKVLEEAESGN